MKATKYELPTFLDYRSAAMKERWEKEARESGLFGRIIVDPAMPPDEIKIIGNGQEVRVVNIGTDRPS